MSKKILSVVLALVFVLSTFAVSAFAANGSYAEDADATYTQTWALEETDNGDGTWTVAVKLTTDYKVGAIQFQIHNSNANVTLDSATLGADIPDAYGATLTCKAATGKVVIVPEPETGADAEVLTDAVIAELVYNVPNGESAELSIKAEDAKTAAKPDGTLIALRMVDEVLETGDMVYGQIVNADAAVVTLGAATAPADLAKKAAAEAGIIIDTAKTFGGKYDGAVYGFSKGASATVFRTVAFLNNAFEATNNGTLEIAKNSGGGYGTGATITVKNSDGTVAKVYVVVIFGDVDCNGTINVNDAALVKNAVNGSATLAENSIERMAANCQPVNNATVMHNLAINDASYIKNYVGTSTAKFSPATLASYQYKFNVNYQ